MKKSSYKIVICTPAIYSAGGVERVVTVKADYFSKQLGYDVTVIVTEGRGRDCFFPISDKVRIINYELNFASTVSSTTGIAAGASVSTASWSSMKSSNMSIPTGMSSAGISAGSATGADSCIP